MGTMDWDRRRFEERRGGESYRPAERPGRSPSRGYEFRRRSPPRARSRPRSRSRPQADTWVPSTNRGYRRPRSRSPSLSYRRRSRTPPGRNFGPAPYERRRSPPRRFSPRRDERIRSPPQSWRSKSPLSDGRSRDLSPRRPRDTTPGSQISRPARRDASATHSTDKFWKPSPPRALQDTPLPYVPPRAPRREVPSDSLIPSRTLSPSRIPRSPQGRTSQKTPAGAITSPPVDVKQDHSQLRSGVSNIPTQPKNHSARPLSQIPPGHYQGQGSPFNQHRAPTRPRAPDLRESMKESYRGGRGLAVPPHGPRRSFSPPASGHGGFRQPIARQPSTPSTSHPLSQNGPTHLAAVSALIPGGKLLPSPLGPEVEKRLSALGADQEKLLEQVAETQRTKREELRDWDRLDRESAICALKSELAEGYLERMADESIGGGIF